jgi:CRISPR-associated endoribonuclease Cas6
MVLHKGIINSGNKHLENIFDTNIHHAENTIQKSLVPEIASVVIHLKAINGTGHFEESGRKIHGLWHSIWKDVSATLADDIHPHNRLPTFTLSPLMGLPSQKTRNQQILPGQEAWFRITTLQSNTTTHFVELTSGRLGKLPSIIELGDVRWDVSLQANVSMNQQWSKLTSYQEIIAPSRASTQWKIAFYSPTSFSGRFVDFPIPLPENLIASWLNRWNQFCPADLVLPEQLIDEAKNNLRITDYELSTHSGNRKTKGCIGSETIRAFELPAKTRMQLDTLFRYATFCGTGHHTAQGMGMTRLIS